MKGEFKRREMEERETERERQRERERYAYEKRCVAVDVPDNSAGSLVIGQRRFDKVASRG